MRLSAVRVQAGSRARCDEGAGAVLALAIVGAMVVLMVAAVGLAGALAARQRTIGAADAAALAAADALSGAVGGVPCDLAAHVAQGGRAAVSSCRTDGLVATVEVSSAFGVFAISAVSTAGPPS